MSKSNKKSNPQPKQVKKQKQQGQRVSAPVAQGFISRTAYPRFTSSSDGRNPRIVHREYIQDIAALYNADTTLSFSITSFSINPGVSTTFPWLSTFAPNYESYMFRRLRFCLQPLVPTSTSGQTFSAVDYDASDATPASKFELLEFAGATSAPMWSDECVVLEGNDDGALGRRRYIRTGSLASNLDIKTYDVGNFLVGTQGNTAGGTIQAASLFVEYDVELFTPQYSLTSQALFLAANITGMTGISETAMYGSAASISGGLPVSAVSNTITFQRPGQYIVVDYIAGTTLIAGSAALSGTATSSELIASHPNAAATDSTACYIVSVLTRNQTFIHSYAALAASVTGVTTRIAPYAYSLA